MRKYIKFAPIIAIILVLQALIHRGIILPDPEVSLFFVKVRWYGVFMALAIVALVIIIKTITKDQKEFKDIEIENVAFIVAIPAIILARLWHVVTDWPLYQNNPIDALYIWNGGLSIFGAVLGVILGLYIYTKRNKLNLLKILNIAALGLPLAQVIGRYGNLFNRELFGAPLDAFWALYVPKEFPTNLLNVEYYHPAYLYEQILNLILLLINIFLYKKFKLSDNIYIVSWLIGYGFIRFVVEFFRVGTIFYAGLTISQFVSIAMVVLGIIILVLNYSTKWAKK